MFEINEDQYFLTFKFVKLMSLKQYIKVPNKKEELSKIDSSVINGCMDKVCYRKDYNRQGKYSQEICL